MNKKIWLILSLLCFFLLTGEFFYSHAEQAMKFRAEYWLKENNIPMAMKYYEYAFELGLKNPASSDAYVNILLKDDIDSFKQEKLLKFLTYKTNDGAMVRAEDYLSDLKSEIRYKYYESLGYHSYWGHTADDDGELFTAVFTDDSFEIEEKDFYLNGRKGV